MPSIDTKYSYALVEYLHLYKVTSKQFSQTCFLYLNGNNLLTFPDESLKDKLIKLGMLDVVNCYRHIYQVFKELKYLDARDNNISILTG